MSFIDQVLAARRVAPQEKLFNTPTGIRRDPNLLATGVVRPQVREGLLQQSRVGKVGPQSEASLTEAWDWGKEKVENILDKISGKEEKDRQSFKEELASSESGGHPTNVVNYRGYMGKYQFGNDRLTDYKNATEETFTNKEFLNNLELQEKVYDWHENDNREHITRNKLDKYIGTKIKGVEVTLEGMLAVSHLGGQTGLIRFLESGGDHNPDDNPDPEIVGTTLLDYLYKHNPNRKAKRKE